MGTFKRRFSRLDRIGGNSRSDFLRPFLVQNRRRALERGHLCANFSAVRAESRGALHLFGFDCRAESRLLTAGFFVAEGAAPDRNRLPRSHSREPRQQALILPRRHSSVKSGFRAGDAAARNFRRGFPIKTNLILKASLRAIGNLPTISPNHADRPWRSRAILGLSKNQDRSDSRDVYAAESPPRLPSGNIDSRYSPRMRQTSIADKMPASLPWRCTMTEPMRRLAISKTTSLSGVRKDAT